MSEEQQVVAYLKALPARHQLAVRLRADKGRLCCYYLCPLSNLESVVRGGIMCHDAASAIVDLSSGEVQYRRHEVWLGKSTADRQYRRAETHRCVNFFWNPLNWTLIAFQRHALLRRHARQGDDRRDGMRHRGRGGLAARRPADLLGSIGGQPRQRQSPQFRAGEVAGAFAV